MIGYGTRGRAAFAELDKVRFGTVRPAVRIQCPLPTVEAVTPPTTHQHRRKFQTTATGVCQYRSEMHTGAAVGTDGR